MVDADANSANLRLGIPEGLRVVDLAASLNQTSTYANTMSQTRFSNA